MDKQISTTAIGKITCAVTKPQQDFNRLNEKINRLRAEINELKSLGDHLQNRMAGEVEPAIVRHNDQLCELARLFDRAHQSGNFKGRELKKLEHLILDLIFPLIEEGYDDLKPIHDRYSQTPYDEMDDETEDLVEDLMRTMMEEMFDIKFDDETDLSDPQKFAEQMAQKISDKHDSESGAHSKGKKSTKNKAKADKKADEAAKTSKSVREVYLDLVKTFHPDREPDESEKIRKTAIMQRVTAAYESNDLLGLLELQLEFERIDTHALANLAEEKLLHFNKVLTKQARELAEESADLRRQLMTLGSMLADSAGIFVRQIKIENIEPMIDRKLRDLKSKMDLLKKDQRELSSSVAMKAFLKDFKIPKASKRDLDFFDF